MKQAQINLADQWKDWLATEGGRLLMYSRQRTGSLEEAEDVLQDSLIRLWGTKRSVDIVLLMFRLHSR